MLSCATQKNCVINMAKITFDADATIQQGPTIMTGMLPTKLKNCIQKPIDDFLGLPKSLLCTTTSVCMLTHVHTTGSAFKLH